MSKGNLDAVRQSKTKPKMILSLRGGSYMYGLVVPSSDIDLRGTFAGEVESIFINDEEHDTLYMRIDRFLASCAKSTQSAEMLFAPKRAVKYVTPKFRSLVMDNAEKFLDTERLGESYLKMIEKQAAFFRGENLPKGGDGKMRKNFEDFGYVPKSFVHTLRGAMQMTEFYASGGKVFPTDFSALFPDTAKLLRDIKTNPEKYTLEMLLPKLTAAVETFNESKAKFAAEGRNFLPDEKYVNKVISELTK